LREKTSGGTILNRRYRCGSTASVAHYYSAVYIPGLNPDVVLIDTKMKQADGIDLCRRALAADKKVRVAILTSYLDPNERRQAYQAGVNGYLLKDVDTDNLAKWIRLAAGRDPGVTES
ncbi:MAG: hypothetical protein BZY87_04645, partial [SAR202 cluster bacterium Io17-Chloro-G6]